MALPTSGVITMDQICAEYKIPVTSDLGCDVLRKAANKPAPQDISMSDFYGKSAAESFTIVPAKFVDKKNYISWGYANTKYQQFGSIVEDQLYGFKVIGYFAYEADDGGVNGYIRKTYEADLVLQGNLTGKTISIGRMSAKAMYIQSTNESHFMFYSTDAETLFNELAQNKNPQYTGEVTIK